MAKKLLTFNNSQGGISPSSKEGNRGSFFFNKNLNIYDDPSEVKLNPKTAKDSGSTVTDLVKWIVSGTPHDTNTYFYGDTGKIYKRTSGGTWSLLRTVSNSGGQGMEVHNDYIYYTQDTQIGRYGTLSGGSPSFTDNWQTGLNDTSATNFAPIKAFKEGLAVGNGNDLGWWDGSVWTQNKIVLPPGFEIRCLEVIDEFLAIGAWRGSGSITDSEQGIVFFWDGTSQTFNYFVEIPEGGINAMLNSQNRLLSVVGSSGIIYLNYNPFTKEHQIPKMDISKYVEIFPGAMTNWKGISHIGVSGATDSTNLEQGVYQWGSKNKNYPEAINYGYVISTGTTTGTTLKIGSVKGIGNQMFIGWRDNTTYGVDKVVQTANPFASGIIESLIFDAGTPAQQKSALTIKATHKALASGESVQLGYKIDRASSYTTDTANSTSNSTETRFTIAGKRFNEIQVEAILAATGSTSPTLISLTLEFEDLADEETI